MKKILILFTLLFLSSPSFAVDHGAVFELKPITEIKDGRVNISTGNYKQIYKLVKGQIYRVYSENVNDSGFTYADNDHYVTTYIPTIAKNDYYYGTFSHGLSNSIITIDKDFKSLTLYQFGGLDNHCTIWDGKAIKKF